MIDTKVLERLSKLMEMSERGTEHEATIAAQRASELMAKHQLTMADVLSHIKDREVIITTETGRVDDEENAPPGKRRELWMEVLLVGVAHACGGKTFKYSHGKTYTFWMVGPPDSVAAARYLYMMLEKDIGRIARKEMKDRGESNSFRRAYARGIAMRIGHRLKEQRTQTFEGASSTALAIVDKQKAAIEAAMPRMSKQARGGHTKTPDAISEGYERGGSVDIGSASSHRLGQGNKELKE